MNLIIKCPSPYGDYFKDLIISLPELDYIKWRTISDNLNRKNLIELIDDTLKDIKNIGTLFSINDFNYKLYLEYFYYYILKLDNQILYNKYIDELQKLHTDLLIYEYEIKQNQNGIFGYSKDVFTNRIVTVNINKKHTKSNKSSSNKNKIKKKKVHIIDMTGIAFNFKKKLI